MIELNQDVIELMERLGAPFEEGEVKFKPAVVSGNRALALPYVDARVVQDRLDEVFGVGGWQDDYERLPDGSVVCRLRVKHPALGPDWIMKTDVGSESEQPDDGDRCKAAFSDALKRAAVKLGVGRYLYRAGQQWVDYDPQKKKFVKPPKLPAMEALSPRKATPHSAGQDLPTTGQELFDRMTAFDARCAGKGMFKSGDLIKHVVRWGIEQGFPADMTRWEAEQIHLATEEAKAFADRHRTARAG